MDEPRDSHTEWSQTERENYHIASLMCKIEKEIVQISLLTKQKETHRLREQIYGFRGGAGKGWGEEIAREIGMDVYTLLNH